MQTTARPRRGPKLRPRAGRLATMLFLGGLAASAATAVAVGGVEPAEAQSTGSAIDQPTAGTLPAGTSTVKGTTDVHMGPGDTTPPPGNVRTSVNIIDEGSTAGSTTRPMQHLPDSMK